MMPERNMPIAQALLWLCISLFLAGCGSSSSRHLGSGSPPGDGGGAGPLPPPGGGGFPPPPGPPADSIEVSGTVTFDRVPFAATANDGLNFDAAVEAPARGVTIEAVSATGGSVLATTQADATGAYTLTLLPNAAVFLRAKAEMARTGPPSWTVRVRDNTSGDALYALDGAVFNTGTVATLTQDLHAASGWDSGSSSYPDPLTRSAGPFAILDDIYQAMQLVLAADATAVFPALDVLWSPDNVPDFGTGDPAVDYPVGNIGTTFFQTGTPAQIYVLGAADEDTDEFDTHVIAHEWGHYYQSVFSRDDSVGGDHFPDERLDLRTAFSEGWGDAFSGMVFNDPLYRDSYDLAQATDGSASLESDATPQPGWFSEGSIGLVFYDLFDGVDAEAESVQLGFGPIHEAMGALKTTDAFSSIHSFINALVPLVPAQAAGVQALVTAQSIVGIEPNDFAPLETNNGGSAHNLPIYKPISVGGGTVQVCSNGGVGESYNKLRNRSFLTFTLATDFTGTINVTSPGPTSDADYFVYEQGVEVASGTDTGDDLHAVNLPAGTYVLEVYESSNVFGELIPPAPIGPICIDVTLAP